MEKLEKRDTKLDWVVPTKSRKSRIGNGIRVNFKSGYVRVSDEFMEPYLRNGVTPKMAFVIPALNSGPVMVSPNPGPGIPFFQIKKVNQKGTEALLIVNKDLVYRLEKRYKPFGKETNIMDFLLTFDRTESGTDLFVVTAIS